MAQEEIIRRAVEGVKIARELCDDVEFSPEDASRTELEFLAQVVEAVIEAGATTVNIPDTVGYTVPDEFAELFRYLRKNVRGIDKVRLSVHCHDDLGMAVANSLTAVVAGARQIECTINGIGERAGNCSLEEVVMALKTRDAFFNVRHEHQHHAPLSDLAPASRTSPACRSRATRRSSARTRSRTKSGIHQHGMLKHHSTYEIMRPQDVGLSRSALVLGKHSGRHALRERVQGAGLRARRRRVRRACSRSSRRSRTRRRSCSTATSRRSCCSAEALAQPARGRCRTCSTVGGQQLASGRGDASACSTATAARSRRRADGRRPGGCGASRPSRRATGVNVALRKFEVRSVTEGEDAQGEALVYVEYNQRTYRGSSVSTNIVESSDPGLSRSDQSHRARAERSRARASAPALRASRRPRCNSIRSFSNAHSRNEVHLVQRQAGPVGEGHGARALARPALRLLGVRRRARLRDAARRRHLPAAAITPSGCSTRRRSIASTCPSRRSRSTTACREVIAQNGLARGAYLRPVAFRGYGEIGVVAEDRSARRSGDRRLGMGQVSRRGARTKASTCACPRGSASRRTRSPRWPRPAATTCRASSSASRRKRLGFAEGIGLSTDGTVSEGAGENLFLIKDGVLYTPGVAHSLLDGITRDTVMTLAKDMGIEVREIADSARDALPRRRGVLHRHGGGESRRSARWTPSRSATASAVRSRETLQAAFFGLVQGKTAGQVGLARPRRHDRAARRGGDATRLSSMMPRQNAVREGLGRPRRRARDRRHARRPVHRPAPDARGDDAAGVHRAARARPASCAVRTSRSRRWTTRRPRAPSRCSAACRSRSIRRRSRSGSSRTTAREFGVELFNLQDSRRGIVHIIGPELGLTQPGKTIVCGDSHTTTHGAFGALAFGIGTTEVGHVLATQCLLQRRPKTFAINVDGKLPHGRHAPRT